MTALYPGVVFQVQILKELVGNHFQSIFGPGLKPVYGAAVDQRREHPETIAEAFTYWAHCYWDKHAYSLQIKITIYSI